MYRSFVTCNDPKGVVECGTIRKPKIGSTRAEGKKKCHRTDKGKREEMAPKENARDYPSPRSFELLEVSRGAQKLNHLIDPWHKGLSYDGQSKDIAKELLKGALDLQESITMLGKLQEASQYVSQLKRKQKEKVEKGRIDRAWCDRIDSDRFGYRNLRLSTDGSRRDCIEELRDAIRDGLAKQNLLANTSSKEKIRFHKRKMDSVSHIPSSSSSQSTHSTDYSMSQTASQNKGNAPSLIAKLMGLDYIPSKPLMQPPQKQLDMEKISSPKRPVFEIEMPNIRKPHPVIQKVGSERRTLGEFLETVQFQGLLKGNNAMELKSHAHQSRNINSKQKLADDIRPIVLIKPLHSPCFDSEEIFTPMVGEEGGSNAKMMPRTMRMKQVTSHATKMHYKAEAEEIPIERIIHEEGAKDQIKAGILPEEREVRIVDHKERTADMNKLHRKLDTEKASEKRLGCEEVAQDRKVVTTKAKEKEAKKRLKDSSCKMKSSDLASHRQQKEETTDKKVDKVQKLVTSSRNPAEEEALKSKNVSRSDDQTKLTSIKLRKAENRSITTDEYHSQDSNTARKLISKNTTQTASYSSKARKHKEKQPSEHKAARPVIEDLDCEEEEKRIDLTCEKQSFEKESIITNVSMEKDTNASKFQPEDHCGHIQSSLTTQSFDYEKDVISSIEADAETIEIRIDGTSLKSENRLKDLLLNSLQFLNPAEELFDLNLSYPKISSASEFYDQGVIDTKLSLDYANEYIQRRSLPDSRTKRPLLCYMGNSSICLSLDQLAEEVCCGVETLRSYHRLAQDELRVDSLCATLDKDMKCKGVASGTWDLGWRYGFSVDEVELAVGDLEKLLVSELIEEVFS